MIANLHLGRTVHSYRNLLQQLLGETHHPVVVLIRYIQLHAGELWVVTAVHTLVAEITADLVHTLKTTYNQSLQVQLCRNTHIHIHVQRVVVRDERTSRSTTRNSLQHWGLHLGVTCLVKHLTHRTNNSRTLQENVLHTFVHHQVHITLTITLLWIGKTVIGHTIFVLHDWQWLQALGQDGQLLCMHTDLAHLGAENKTLNTNKIADVQQLLKDYVVHLLLHGGSYLALWHRGLHVVATDIYLYTTLRVLHLDERGLTHDTTRHQATRNTHGLTCIPRLFAFRLIAWNFIREVPFDIGRITCYFILSSRIGVDTHIAHFLQTFSAYQFLFRKFHIFF